MQILAIVGQVIFGIFWIRSGINHLAHVNMLTGYAASKKVPLPRTSIIVTGLLLLVGGVGYILGLYIWWATLALIVFLIPTTFMMHNFWTASDPQARASEQVHFMKNMALIGALLMLWSAPMLAYSLF
ncbi:MAG: DoxX family membrane protein [Candidatus Pacebacteria bacterium]|nr:DoxX family membrane protein [Candidatus Paceibacterota bacterium]